MYARRGRGQWRLVAVAFTLLLVLAGVLLVVPGQNPSSGGGNVGGGPTATPPLVTPEPTPAPQPDNPYPRGSRLKMTDGVNLRVSASLQGAVLATVPVGHEVVVLEGPSEADGYRWWRIETAMTPPLQGWMAEGEWWERVSTPPPAAPAPTPTPVP